jgi:hypothetical protein
MTKDVVVCCQIARHCRTSIIKPSGLVIFLCHLDCGPMGFHAFAKTDLNKARVNLLVPLLTDIDPIKVCGYEDEQINSNALKSVYLNKVIVNPILPQDYVYPIAELLVHKIVIMMILTMIITPLFVAVNAHEQRQPNTAATTTNNNNNNHTNGDDDYIVSFKAHNILHDTKSVNNNNNNNKSNNPFHVLSSSSYLAKRDDSFSHSAQQDVLVKPHTTTTTTPNTTTT